MVPSVRPTPSLARPPKAKNEAKWPENRPGLRSPRDSVPGCIRCPALKRRTILTLRSEFPAPSIYQRRRGVENLALHRLPVAIEQEERIPLDRQMHLAVVRPALVAPHH